MKRIAIVTDAWHPQINGVVTTLGRTIRDLESFGYLVKIINPSLFKSCPCPSYPEINLSLAGPARVGKELSDFSPHSIHIATEGPLGWAARAVCKKTRFPFSTSYHTRFPEYLRLRWPIPLSLSYNVLRCFHKAATKTMVATNGLRNDLKKWGIDNTVLWSRGVDSDMFHPEAGEKKQGAKPVFMYMGRVAVEKNIEAFLKLDLPGNKVVVGDGPAKDELCARYPETEFTGFKQGKELSGLLAAADVFVFPSLTDTFGVVLLEAMASGVPVAAYPVTGPKETVINGINGYLDEDLRTAALKALDVSSKSCREYALNHSWKSCSEQFLSNLPIQDQPFSC